LSSPKYGVKGCRAEVLQQGASELKPLDDTIFNHAHFRESGRHYRESNDTVKLEILTHFKDDLFEI
jgi:hypothetical protein